MSQAGIVDFIGTHPSISTMFVANVGTAVPIANTIEILGAVVAPHNVPIQTVGSGNTINIDIQYASSVASSNASYVGLAAFDSSQFNVDANGFVTLVGGTTNAVLTMSDDVNTIVDPSASGNIQLIGHVVEQGATKFSTVKAGTNLLNINPMSSARWIVDGLGFNGTHTTIAAALAAASSGDTILILPGTYTENLTLPFGVNLKGYDPGEFLYGSSSVIIKGKIIDNGTDIANTISGIELLTNSDYVISLSGESSVILLNCRISASNNTPFNMTNTSANIFMYESNGDLGTTGIALTSQTHGDLWLYSSQFTNSGGSTTGTTISDGSIITWNSQLQCPLATSGTGLVQLNYSSFGSPITPYTNQTWVTTAGTGGQNIINTCNFYSGTASAISVGSGTTLTFVTGNVNSSNTNAITGGGTLVIGDVFFSGSSSTINTTTVTGLPLNLKQGGTNASLTASNNGMVYSTASALAILAMGNSQIAATNSSGTLGARAFSVNIQTFTSGTSTYTPTTGMLYCIVECVGGGGGGGGVGTTSATTMAAAAGGGGGGYSRSVLSAATVGASKTVVVGTGGGGGSGNANGSAGNDTTFNSTTVVAKGGSGGNGTGNNTIGSTQGGGGGVTGTGTFSYPGGVGGMGFWAIVAGTGAGSSGVGGSSHFGGGAQGLGSYNGSPNSSGNTGTNYGSGGSGAASGISQGSTATGGSGQAGFCVITEFIIN
jgi:hypothetical protein